MRIDYYILPNGRVPVKEYINSLDAKLASKTLRSIGLLEACGHMLGEPESKHLGDGIFELRTVMGNNAGRVLYFFMVDDRVVLTHGFVKKTRKTPRGEVERARRYKADYLKRVKEGVYGKRED